MKVTPNSKKNNHIIINKLSKKGVFTLSEANKVGLSNSKLYRMLSRGIIIKVARGIYSIDGKEPHGDYGDFVIATSRLGKGVVIGGITALTHYGLTDEVPTQIWVLVPPSLRTIDKRYRVLRTKRNLKEGVLIKNGYQIVSLERAVIDSLVYISKVGEKTAILSAVRAIRRQLTTSQKLFSMAKKLDCLEKLEAYWQAILAGVHE